MESPRHLLYFLLFFLCNCIILYGDLIKVSSFKNTFHTYFVGVGVMYSGEYDVCDVILSVHPHWAS
jgi:hypothetical protein